MKKKLVIMIDKFMPVYNLFQYVVIITYLTFVFTQAQVSFWFYLLIPFVDSILFIFCKDYSDSPKKVFTLYRIRMLFLCLAVVCRILRALELAINIKIPLGIKVMFSVFGVAFAFYLLFADNEKKQRAVAEIRVKERLGTPEGTTQAGEKSNYDVKLCVDKETGKDVYLLTKDLFLHMLVLGPTGCGKTSQVLIPMVLQHIQKDCGVTIIEPKGDFAEIVYAMGVKYGVPVTYFNPIFPDCPYLNPLDGEEDVVIENLTTTFDMLMPDSKTYYKELAGNLIRKSLMVVKRIEAAYTNPETGISSRPATLVTLSELIHNTDNKGRNMVNELASIPTLNESEEKQNLDTRDWFLNDYFADRSISYQNTSGIRTLIANLNQNKYLRRVFNPKDGKSQINFDEILENGGKLAVSTAQGSLRELGSCLGYFIILFFQSAVFRRPGNERTRRPHFLYIDEFQKYSNPGFSDMLTQGRSYAVASILATQSRQQITMGSGLDGRSFLEVISANARNQILFPGISSNDAKYFSDAFGEKMVVDERISHTKQEFKLGYGFRNMNYPTESVSQSEKQTAIYSTTDITYKEFSEITYRIIKNNSVQFARDGITSYIDKELNEELDNIIEDYRNKQFGLLKQENDKIKEEREKQIRNFLKTKGEMIQSSVQNMSQYSSTAEDDPWAETVVNNPLADTEYESGEDVYEYDPFGEVSGEVEETPDDDLEIQIDDEMIYNLLNF